VVERRFLGELIALENRLSRGYGDGQPKRLKVLTADPTARLRSRRIAPEKWSCQRDRGFAPGGSVDVAS
jgi:hypothetical protein